MVPNSSTLFEAGSDTGKSAMPSLLTENHPLCVCHKPLFDVDASTVAFGERAETKRRHRRQSSIWITQQHLLEERINGN